MRRTSLSGSPWKSARSTEEIQYGRALCEVAPMLRTGASVNGTNWRRAEGGWRAGRGKVVTNSSHEDMHALCTRGIIILCGAFGA